MNLQVSWCQVPCEKAIVHMRPILSNCDIGTLRRLAGFVDMYVREINHVKVKIISFVKNRHQSVYRHAQLLLQGPFHH